MSSVLVTIHITIRVQESEVRNPHSVIIEKVTTIRIRESVPYHDPGRTATILLCCHSVEVCAL